MNHIFHPYIVGSDSPIPYLFEKINPHFCTPKTKITTFTNKKGGILNNEYTNEIYVGDKSTALGAFRYYLKSPFVSLKNFDLIHTGARARDHRRMAWLSKKRNPDISHLHTLRIDVDPELPSHPEKEKIVRMADKVTAVSQHVAITAQEVFGIEPKVIYNGVDTSTFHPNHNTPEYIKNLETDGSIFLFVGTLEERKRPDDVVEVAKILKKHEFIIVGGGPLLENIREMASDLDNVHILGKLPKQDLPPIYSSCDALIFPSIKEGCPNVVMEGMASGLPVVGYEATSMPEIVNHLKTGYLGEDCNIRDLAKGCEQISEKPEDMGQRARQHVEKNHNFKTIAQDYQEEYRRLIKNHQRQ